MSVPCVYIKPEAHAKLRAYIDSIDLEISGLGLVGVINGVPVVEDILLLEQEVTSTTTDLDATAVSKLLEEAVKTSQPLERLKCWWHSHVRMGVFWSGTDTGTIDACFTRSGWMVSIVGNKKGEYKCRIDMYEPFRLTVDDLPLVVHYPALEMDVKEEVAKKVRQKTWDSKCGYPAIGKDSQHRPPFPQRYPITPPFPGWEYGMVSSDAYDRFPELYDYSGNSSRGNDDGIARGLRKWKKKKDKARGRDDNTQTQRLVKPTVVVRPAQANMRYDDEGVE